MSYVPPVNVSSACLIIGMHRFRWVSLQLESLRKCLPKHVERTLERLPETLGETYGRMLDGIDKKYTADVLRVLACMTYSQVPMSLEQLAEVFTIDFETHSGIPELNPEHRVSDPAYSLQMLCSSFVIISGTNIGFSHLSVKEYLLSCDAPLRYRLTPATGFFTLAQMCMACLLSAEYIDDPNEELPLATYASRFWMLYASHPDVVDRLSSSLNHFLSLESQAFQVWADYFLRWRRSTRSRMETSPDGEHTRIYLYQWEPKCSHDRFLKRLPSWLTRRLRLHPLICAAFYGFSKQVKMLVLDAEELEGDIVAGALLGATCSGELEALRAILELDPACSVSSERLTNAFLDVCDPGWLVPATEFRSKISQLSIMHLLLEHGAAIDVHEAPRGEKPLAILIDGWYSLKTDHKHNTRWILEENATSMLHLLMERGADLNAITTDGSPILIKLVDSQFCDVVFEEEGTPSAVLTTLLRAGADTTAAIKASKHLRRSTRDLAERIFDDFILEETLNARRSVLVYEDKHWGG